MSRSRCCDAALYTLTVVFVVGILNGCGDDTTASTSPKRSSRYRPADELQASPQTTPAARQRNIDEIVSNYLSKIIDAPDSVRDPATSTATINKLASEVGDASRKCKTTVLRVSKIIDRTDLSGAAKRFLDAMLPVYGDC